jgi:single-stranded DNA-specific DHH superfamily exonuclease
MLSEKQLDQIRDFVEKAQNPLFLFDNDVDGLASFLLLRRACGKGKGVAIKSFPGLNANYVGKLHEFNPDYIFVLDKALIDKDFRDAARDLSMPIVWIDHHEIAEGSDEENIFYFNPKQNAAESKEPVAYMCYKAVRKTEDEWIAMLGCLTDWYIPDFAKKFSEKYPELFPYTEDAGKALYETEIGKIIKMLNFALMDRTSVVVNMLKNLLTIKAPHELLDITSKTASIYRRYAQINNKYEKLIDKAKEIAKTKNDILFFQYGGELSLSAQISNELLYWFPERIIVVAFIRGAKANVSLRCKKGRDIRKPLAKAMEGIEGTSGGGHKEACGASLQVEDLPKFHANLVKAMETEK